jgi:hypothetical protein
MTARWLARLLGHHRAARMQAEQAEAAEQKVREEVTVPLRELRADDWITRAVHERILGNRPPPPARGAAGR